MEDFPKESSMKLGMVGLGKMGANIIRRLLREGHQIIAYDLKEEAIAQVELEGAKGARTLVELASRLESPRVVWVMVPSGEPTEETIFALRDHLSEGDILIDGGNSNYKDSIRRSGELASSGVHFVDVGTSGGIWGLEEGYSMMVGGEKKEIDQLRPIFETLAPSKVSGWGHVGSAGSGHFVKMIHNGIEYGMMQALAEGFAIMESKSSFDLDLHQVAEIWRHGSVVRSWLLDLTAKALSENPDLEGIEAYVSDSGEGRWTVAEALEQDVSAPVITLSLLERFRSRNKDAFGDKLLAAMRNQFGGHEVKKKGNI